MVNISRVTTGLALLGAAIAMAACSAAPPDDVRVQLEGVKAVGCMAYGAGCSAPPGVLDIPMNGLPTHVLAANLLSASVETSPLFVGSPLNSDTFKAAGPLRSALVDPGTRQFLRYALRCAMVPSQSFHISGTDVVAGKSVPWSIDETGRLGLCPEWARSSADAACQERVSACLLAENNPLGVHVALSVRGAVELGQEPLRKAVPTITAPYLETKLDGNDVMPQFVRCSSAAFGTGAECGWNPTARATGFIGLCEKGQTVSIGTGGMSAPACNVRLGTSSNDTVIRVCAGIAGCNDATRIGTNDNNACGLQSFLTFTCPDNAPASGESSAFSVMIASSNRSLEIVATAEAARTSNTAPVVSYPAAEVDVFKLREGAFFGNLFDASALSVTYTWVSGELVRHLNLPTTGHNTPQYRNLFACGDPSFPQSTANITARVCAVGSKDCLATPVGSCDAVCERTEAPGAYGGCRVRDTTFPSLTTYLRSALDVYPNGP